MKELAYLDANPEIIEKMRESAIADSFDETHFTGIITRSKVRQYDPGEKIIEEGEVDDKVYMLLSGKVRVSKKGTDLCVLSHTGDIFGEMAVITGSPRSASVHAVDPTDCLVLDASYMYSLRDDEKVVFVSTLFRIFIEVLTRRLKVMNERFVWTSAHKPDSKG